MRAEAEMVMARKKLAQLPSTIREIGNGSKTDEEVEAIIAEARVQIDGLRHSLHEVSEIASKVERLR